MLMTQWGENLDENAILQEYPRPQLRRDSYLNLNGLWDYAITEGAEEPEQYDGKILVPFSPESALSRVNRTLLSSQTLWYKREVSVPAEYRAEGRHVLLHFGAVDQQATVYWNGREAARHMGGYNAFCADITFALAETNILTVRVTDDTDSGWHSRGKQKTKRGGIWYTPQSGIWQTVWLESVPETYVTGLHITPLAESEQLELTVFSSKDAEYTLTLQGKSYTGKANRPQRFSVKEPRLWSPDDPYLYDFSITLGQDKVDSYFAMRSVCMKQDEKGIPRLYLNGEVCFMNGLLDQGYWPDGLYTPPSDQAMIYDIQTAKALGYNLLRKHIKVEPMRWYYHCDRLGMLVWQDMVSGGEQYHFPIISGPLVTGIHMKDSHYGLFARKTEAGRQEYYHELAEMVRQLWNVPSIVLWVPFNEGWGQFDAAKAVQVIQELDSSRLIDHASGWHDQGISDVKSLHVYFKPYRFKADKHGRAVVLSEFGGYNLRMDGHCWDTVDYGYKRFDSKAALWAAYEGLYEKEILPAIPKGLCAAVYTQLTDVEDELNGVLTYDRKEIKLDEQRLQSLNRKIDRLSKK